MDKYEFTRKWLSHIYVDLWFIISVLLLIGAIMYTNHIRPYFVFASILWIVASGLLLAGTILNFIGRRA